MSGVSVIEPTSALARSRASAVAESSPAGQARAASSARDTWRTFCISRLVVWIAACVGVLLLGTSAADVRMYDPGGISTGLGTVGNVLAAPAVRWDAIWYLQIAAHGYSTPQTAGFFPLFPLLIRAGSYLTGSYVVSGIVISLGALLVGLELVRRLTELELGPEVARTTVQLIAFAPLAVFLSAIYTESLFLALTAGAFYAARRGRWCLASMLAALSAVERVGGVMLAVPIAILFFYGPRCDAPPEVGGPWWKPRYGFSAAVLWAFVVPLSAAAFQLYLQAKGFGPSATAHAQERYWSHQIAFPLATVWHGLLAAGHQLGAELSGSAVPLYGSDALLQAGTLIATAVALVGVWRRLPAAYGAFVTLGVLQHLSSPTAGDPLRGLDRYASMRFPLFMCVAMWAVERGYKRQLLFVSFVLCVVFAFQFAGWQWVGSDVL